MTYEEYIQDCLSLLVGEKQIYHHCLYHDVTIYGDSFFHYRMGVEDFIVINGSFKDLMLTLFNITKCGPHLIKFLNLDVELTHPYGEGRPSWSIYKDLIIKNEPFRFQ